MPASMVSRATVLAATMVLCAGLAACGDDTETGAERPGPIATVAPQDAAGAAGGGTSNMCLASITYRNQTYVGAQVSELAVGEPVGKAVTTPCDDTGDGADGGSAAEPFPVLGIEGIDPSDAVATEVRSGDAKRGYWLWYVADASGQAPDAVRELLD